MTVIVGVQTSKGVWIGGDSASSSNWTVRQTTLPKVFRRADMLIGYTTSFRMAQLLQYVLEMPSHEPNQTDMGFLVGAFVPAVRTLFKERGFATVNSNEESGGTFLIGYRGALYRMQSDYTINQNAYPYAAVGCGTDFAIGALHASFDPDRPKKSIEKAIRAAAHYSAFVQLPYIIERL